MGDVSATTFVWWVSLQKTFVFPYPIRLGPSHSLPHRPKKKSFRNPMLILRRLVLWFKQVWVSCTVCTWVVPYFFTHRTTFVSLWIDLVKNLHNCCFFSTSALWEQDTPHFKTHSLVLHTLSPWLPLTNYVHPQCWNLGKNFPLETCSGNLSINLDRFETNLVLKPREENKTQVVFQRSLTNSKKRDPEYIFTDSSRLHGFESPKMLTKTLLN